MKRKSVWFSIAATVFFAGAIGGYFLYWIYQIEPGMGGGNFGYEVALNFDGTGRNFIAFGGLVFVVLGFLISLVLMIISLIRRNKPHDLEKPINPKKATLVLVFALLCCVVPLCGAASAMEMYGVANDNFEMMGKVWGYFCGEGIPVASVCAILGGISFFYSYSGILD